MTDVRKNIEDQIFLLTPLREGRPAVTSTDSRPGSISTHAPAGGATLMCYSLSNSLK